ncbi:NUDIX domain-containing protein [Jeotgalibaca porci]|uniref:NUDIX domain-containing protein n=1 Tax=Jeotgalibaca porci TaxID=1868793 RepID=UPI00359F2F49
MYHRAFGVYGIIANKNQLLVIKKNGGPYTNRYDLCGGSLEEGELLEEAVVREVKEETGLDTKIVEQIGTVSYRYPWKYAQYTDNLHICVFYKMVVSDYDCLDSVEAFDGQDSLGSQFVYLEDLTKSNSSPLVLTAKHYLESGQFQSKSQCYSEWEVLDTPVF